MHSDFHKVLIFSLLAICFTGFVFAHEEAIVEIEDEGVASGTEFFESFIIILREGLEAILIIGAVIAYLVASNNEDKVKVVYFWAGVAVIASLLTAFLFDQIFHFGKAQQEMLEGVTMLLAAGVLLYVTNWLLGKIDSKKWNSYIKGKVDDALTSGNTLALGAISFLAVYREGFETVLFFKALSISSTDTASIFGGLILGLIVLAILFVLILRLEKKLPLNIVFGGTSILLFLLSVKFAGKGVHELQEAHILPETALNIVPKIGDLGIYPTLETLGIQVVVILIGAILVFVHFKSKGQVKK